MDCVLQMYPDRKGFGGHSWLSFWEFQAPAALRGGLKGHAALSDKRAGDLHASSDRQKEFRLTILRTRRGILNAGVSWSLYCIEIWPVRITVSMYAWIPCEVWASTSGNQVLPVLSGRATSLPAKMAALQILRVPVRRGSSRCFSRVRE